jgi:hypothetical protein
LQIPCRIARCAWLASSLFVFIPCSLRQSQAQQFAPNEITVGTAFQGGSNDGLAAPAFTYTHNLSPSLALEGTYLPTSTNLNAVNQPPNRETMLMGGVKAGWRGERWGLYGTIKTGIVRLSETPVTNFGLEYGGVAEYHLSRRYSLRFDAAYLQILDFDKYLQRTATFYILQPGAVAQQLDARFGVTRTFGRLTDVRPERVPVSQAWDAGVLFALQPRIEPSFRLLDPYPEWGLWASWNFSKHFSWDSAVLHSPRNPSRTEVIDYQAGGRALEALTGVKIGVRRDHMGYFGVVRPGTITFGETQRQIDVLPSGNWKFDEGMFTDFVLNSGGAFEVYPTRHSILRFDAGNAMIFYRPKNVIQLGQTYHIPGQTQTSMFISFGAGFRF